MLVNSPAVSLSQRTDPSGSSSKPATRGGAAGVPWCSMLIDCYRGDRSHLCKWQDDAFIAQNSPLLPCDLGDVSLIEWSLLVEIQTQRSYVPGNSGRLQLFGAP